ncbi:Cytoplasmic tRNA 2-thiolation protein 2 [Blastocladiella emersonii ATCC 22665]|nr:Cytoplasmic tRNA 2-thiolation protein 2 [Blastocladiella emersonii ATCC 22665]
MCDRMQDDSEPMPSSPAETNNSRGKRPAKGNGGGGGAPRVAEAEPGFCKKCKTGKATLAVRQAVYCRDCFMAITGEKFADSVVRLRLPMVPPGGEGRVLMAFSGGTASRTMLDLMAARLAVTTDPRKPRMFTTGEVVCIDESEVIPHDPSFDERIAAAVASYSLPLTTVKLSAIFDYASPTEICVAAGLDVSVTERPNGTSAEELLADLFNGTPSVSAKEDLLRILRRRLLIEVAARRGFKYLVLGTSTSTLAHSVLTATVAGRGAGIPLLLRGADTISTSSGEVMVLQPMSQFATKELALWCHFARLDVIPLPTLTSSRPPGLKVGIHQLTHTFLATLERSKEGTASAVYRTAARLETKSVAGEWSRTRADACGMCAGAPREDGRPVCHGCATMTRELQRKDKRGLATREVAFPALDMIRGYLLNDEASEDDDERQE